MIGIDPRINLLSKLLDVASLRQKVIAQNVANVNTPGYKQRVVSFEDVFTKEVSKGNMAAALSVQPKIEDGPGGAQRVDGNNVDIDVEMANLNKNSLLYRTISQIMISDLSAMRTAIAGR